MTTKKTKAITQRTPQPDDPAAFTSTSRHNNGSQPDRHPSWGMVGISRQTISGGGKRLFGSSVPAHSVIALTVRRASRRFDLHEDWFHGEAQVVEIELSAVQFAELLTSHNVGDGVPCTIRYVTPHGEGHVDDVPDEPTLRERVIDDFKADVDGWAGRLQKMSNTIDQVLAKPNITQGDRKVIQHELQQMIQHVSQNVPFTVTQFERATDRTTAAAKAEVDAFVTSAVQRLGFEKLDELKAALGAGEPTASAPTAVAVRAVVHNVEGDRAVQYLSGGAVLYIECPYGCGGNVYHSQGEPGWGPGFTGTCMTCDKPVILEGTHPDHVELWWAVDSRRLPSDEAAAAQRAGLDVPPDDGSAGYVPPQPYIERGKRISVCWPSEAAARRNKVLHKQVTGCAHAAQAHTGTCAYVSATEGPADDPFNGLTCRCCPSCRAACIRDAEPGNERKP